MVLIEDIKTETGLLKASFIVNGRKYPVYFRSQLQFAHNVSDVLLLLALPAAMRCGVSLKIDQAVSPMLYRQLPALQDIYQDWEPKLRQVEVIAPLRNPVCAPASDDKRGQAISFTGGG